MLRLLGADWQHLWNPVVLLGMPVFRCSYGVGIEGIPLRVAWDIA
jgi:hypothetical protein